MTAKKPPAVFYVFVFNLLFLLFVFQPRAEANLTFFYVPEQLSSIKYRLFVDTQSDARCLNVSAFGFMGADSRRLLNDDVPAWQVGDFSGVMSPAPLEPYQRGVGDGVYGSTAVQMAGTEVGLHLQTLSIPEARGSNHGLANLQVKYRWNDKAGALPWTHANSKLRFQFRLKIPQYYMSGGAVGYVYASFLLKDRNGSKLWIQPVIFDTRKAPSEEHIGWDKGTNSGFVNTFYDYENSTRYGSRDAWSHWSVGDGWFDWRTYSFTIDKTQLGNAIHDLSHHEVVKKRRGASALSFSSDPADYELSNFTIQSEIYWPVGDGALSVGVKDIYLYEEY